MRKKKLLNTGENKSMFKKINKIDKPLDGFIKKNRETIQTNKIRNKKEATTDTTKIQKIIRNYYKHLYSNTMDNLEEMYKFLKKYNLPRLNQQEIENMERPITITEIEIVIKNLPTNKNLAPVYFTGEFCKHLEKNQHLYFSKSSLKLKRKLHVFRKESSQTHSMRSPSI